MICKGYQMEFGIEQGSRIQMKRMRNKTELCKTKFFHGTGISMQFASEIEVGKYDQGYRIWKETKMDKAIFDVSGKE